MQMITVCVGLILFVVQMIKRKSMGVEKSWEGGEERRGK